MKTILTNAFSLNMFADHHRHIVEFIPKTAHEAAQYLTEDWQSAVGHPDTAALFSEQLGVRIPANRVNVQLIPRQTRLIVGQYVGPRLPEGATTLPDGAEIRWWLVVADR